MPSLPVTSTEIAKHHELFGSLKDMMSYPQQPISMTNGQTDKKTESYIFGTVVNFSKPLESSVPAFESGFQQRYRKPVVLHRFQLPLN